MDFVLSDEQKSFRETLRSFLASEYPFARRQAAVAQGRGFDSALWRALAELGVLSLPFDARFGGSAGTGVDTYIAFEALGRALAAEPAVSTLLLAGRVLERGGSLAQQQELIPKIIAGEAVIAVALYEPQSRYSLRNVRTRALRRSAGYAITGCKSVVYAAPIAQELLVTARTTGGERDPDGISVFRVPPDAPGLSRRDYPTVDGFCASELQLDGVSVADDALVGVPGGGLPLVEAAADEATLGVCAEAVGAMEALVERTLQFCRDRVAFGQPISKFQVVQHRLVDMRVAYEHAAAISMRAARRLAEPALERAAAVSAAKVQVDKEADFVGRNAVQLHGAIGMTDELDVGHYFKRLVALGSCFGDADHHLRRFIDTSAARRAPHVEPAA